MGPEEDAYGKTVSELQTGISINGTAISGTLNYVTGYTGFNGLEVGEQSGNYLALKFDSDPWPTKLTVELVGGTKGPVTLTEDTDEFCVFRITSNTTQSIKVSADGHDTTYTLTGLTLTPEE